MRDFTLGCVALGCFMGVATAQGVGPGLIRGPAASQVFNKTKLSALGTGFPQISLWKLPGDTTGVWTACLTVWDLTSTYGGNGSTNGLVIGSYDQVKQTFTPSTNAAKLNSTSHEFGLMVEPRLGRYAVFDRFTNRFRGHVGVFFSSRVPTQAFSAPVQVQGLTINFTFADPALGYVGGKLKLFFNAIYNNVQGIYMQDLDISNLQAPKVTGTAVLVAKSNQGGQMHSAMPITGPDGDVEGLWLGDVSGSDSDMYFANDLDPATPNHLVINTSSWLNNGGIAGGVLHWADTASPYYEAVKDAEAAWLLGDNEAVGGTADIFGAVVTKSLPLATKTIVFVSDQPTAPVSVPGFYGMVALNVNVLAVLGTMQHTNADHTAALSLPIPNNPKLKGLRVALQGFAVDPTKPIYALTNTAWLVVR